MYGWYYAVYRILKCRLHSPTSVRTQQIWLSMQTTQKYRTWSRRCREHLLVLMVTMQTYLALLRELAPAVLSRQNQLHMCRHNLTLIKLWVLGMSWSSEPVWSMRYWYQLLLCDHWLLQDEVDIDYILAGSGVNVYWTHLQYKLVTHLHCVHYHTVHSI